jgi:uncharacterized protein YcbX
MTAATVQDLYVSPVKGGRGHHPAALRIDPGVGVLGDRRFAIKRQPDQPDGWASKVHFRVAMNTPQMAAQVPRLLEPSRTLDPSWLAEVASVLRERALGTVDTKGDYNLVDTDPFKHGPTISFLNLASLRALEAETGWQIDPERFRMNVWYDDGEPFSELAFADQFPGTRMFSVGDLPLRLQDACERCLAIEANPLTGERDLKLLDAIEKTLRKLGYRGSPHRGSFHVMGFLGTPLGAAVIVRGQEIRWL